MKSRKLTLALAIGTAFGCSVLTVACGGSDSAVVQILTPTTAALQAVATPIQVQVVDAADAPITDTDFTLTVTGTNKDKVVDALGNTVTSVTTTGGAALLTLASGTTLPASFNVMVSGTGYLPTGKSVTVSATGTVDVSVPVVKLVTAAPVTQADGSTVAALTGTATGVSGNVTVTPSTALSATGVVTAAAGLSFKSPDTTTATDSQVKLTIPSGVKMTDASGQPITGTVTANVVSYSPTQDTALAAFPGGFAASVAATSTATTTTPGTFVSGGFAAFNLVDSTGKTVKNFDKPVTASITVPAGTTNPDGTAIVIGQSLPIWSYDETNGRWVTENQGTVASMDASGNYVVNFSVTHLSYWNMDWHYSTVCTANVSVKMPAGVTRVNLSAKFVGQSGYLYTGYADGATPFKVYNAPANKEVDIKMSVPGTAVTKTTRITNLCASGGTISLDASTIPVPLPGSMSGTIYEACFNTSGVEIANTRRPLVASVRVSGYNTSNQYVNRTTASNTAGTYSFTGMGAGSAYSLFSSSPRRFSVAPALYYGYKNGQAVASGANTAIADYVFPMRCTGITGAAQ